MAAKDMLAAGLKCVTYANGSMHTLSDYAEMAIRTAAKRAYLQGAGEKTGMGACHTIFFEGISKEESKYTKEELDRIGENYTNEQKEKYIKRQVEKYDRLSKNSLDEENKKKYKARKEEWQNRLKSIKNSKSNTKNEEWKKKYVKDLKRDKKDDKVEPIMKDITDEWKKVSHENVKKVKDLTEYEVDGTVYKVDGRHVVLDYSQYEKEVADILANKYGREVNMIPRISYPQGISTADYLINGVRYDLKTIKTAGKNVLNNAIQKKKRQSSNFIFDISECPLTEEDIISQIERIYKSFNTRFVDEIVLLKKEDIVKVYKR